MIRTVNSRSDFIYEGDYVGGGNFLDDPNQVRVTKPYRPPVDAAGPDLPLPIRAPIPVTGGPGPVPLGARQPRPIGPQVPARPVRSKGPPKKIPTVNPGEASIRSVTREQARDRSARGQGWKRRLAVARRNWGPQGHVMTINGVRIFRRHNKVHGPDGSVVTLPVFYTKQKLVRKGKTPTSMRNLPLVPDPELRNAAPFLSVDTGQKESTLPVKKSRVMPVDDPARGVPVEGIGSLGFSREPSRGMPVQATSLEEIIAIVKDQALTNDERRYPDGPGPAAETVQVDVLPGEVDERDQGAKGPKVAKGGASKWVLGGAALAALLYLGS